MLQIVNDMEPDDRMRLLDELPESSWQKFVDELATTEKAITERFAHYDANLAGRYVTPEYISLPTGLNASEALADIRRNGRGKETLNLVYIVLPDGKLIDELKLSSLVMADPLRPVSDIVDDLLVTVKDTDTLEDAIVLFEKYDRVALPVVDENRKMLGILTFDDVMDVARLAATREIQKFGGMEALDAPYFSVRMTEMLRKRGGWLALLFLGEMLTATAMSHFEDEIAKAVVLALFVPSSSAVEVIRAPRRHLSSFVLLLCARLPFATGGGSVRVRSCSEFVSEPSSDPSDLSALFCGNGLGLQPTVLITSWLPEPFG
jgi:magnesium transporter